MTTIAACSVPTTTLRPCRRPAHPTGAAALRRLKGGRATDPAPSLPLRTDEAHVGVREEQVPVNSTPPKKENFLGGGSTASRIAGTVPAASVVSLQLAAARGSTGGPVPRTRKVQNASSSSFLARGVSFTTPEPGGTFTEDLVVDASSTPRRRLVDSSPPSTPRRRVAVDESTPRRRRRVDASSTRRRARSGRSRPSLLGGVVLTGRVGECGRSI